MSATTQRATRCQGKGRMMALGCLGLITVISACGGDDEPDESQPKSGTYSATIRWTTHGIPHIGGATLKDVIFGQGYAYAKLNVCTLADQIVKVNSQRSRWFGPGADDANVESDFTYRALGVRKWATNAWSDGISDLSRQVISAYAAGYNLHLAKVGLAGLPERCRNAAWVKPLEPVDLLTYYGWLSLNASSGFPLLADLIGSTDGPPTDVAAATGRGDRHRVAWLQDWPQAVRRGIKMAPRAADRHAIGSNGWAIGKERSANGRGMVLANPHFPWFGELRMYETHLKTEDGFEATGAALQGVPGVLIGFSRSLAWTATVSASVKFIAYELALKPGDPMTYLVDGKEHKISSKDEVIDVLAADGSMGKRTRTYYRSKFGPMLEVGLLGPIGAWNNERAFTLRDANANNLNLIDHFLGMATASDVAGAIKVFETLQGNPWTNSMIADSAGRAFYSESNSTPNLTKAAIEGHTKAVATPGSLASIVWQFGFYLMDGSTSANAWVEEAGSREPGLVPWSKTPHLERDDYVANANESHWLSNPHAPLEGYSRVFGPERTTRGLRTRMGLRMLEEKSADGASGADGKFTLDELAAVPFNNRTLGAELLMDGVVSLCADVTSVAVGGDKVDIQAGCATLKAWDRTLGPDSEGAVLWRELASGVSGLRSSKILYATPFSLKDPANTPKDVAATAGKKLGPALAQAIKRLAEVAIPLDATLGQWQFTKIAGKKYPVHGGLGPYGAFNVTGWSAGRDSTIWPVFEVGSAIGGSGLTAEGYPINYGSSFVMAMSFTDDGPKGRALLTYSQSAEPDSPYAADQTALLGQTKLRPVLFEDAEIDADPNLVVEQVKN